jgi:hypothetical protein
MKTVFLAACALISAGAHAQVVYNAEADDDGLWASGDVYEVREDARTLSGSWTHDAISYTASIKMDVVTYFKYPGASHVVYIIPEAHKTAISGGSWSGSGRRLECPYDPPGANAYTVPHTFPTTPLSITCRAFRNWGDKVPYTVVLE